jgi:hypothetical protein
VKKVRFKENGKKELLDKEILKHRKLSASLAIRTNWYLVRSSRSNFLMTVIIPVLSPIANCLRSFPERIAYVTGSFSGSTA